MPELSRAQVVVYGAIAVALLLVGARAIRADAPPERAVAESGAQPAAGETSGDSGELEISGDSGDVVVHVTGAVGSPGVYRLPFGARVDDAVRRAGGALGGAAVDGVNLAARLADGQQVVVPERGASAVAAGVGSGTVGGEDGPISLGTASAERLEAIDGIGPVTAADIVEFREERGGLASVEQLDEVPGIGPATMEALRERLQP